LGSRGEILEDRQVDLSVVKSIFGRKWMTQSLPVVWPTEQVQLYRTAWLAYMQGQINSIPRILKSLHEAPYRRTLEALWFLTRWRHHQTVSSLDQVNSWQREVPEALLVLGRAFARAGLPLLSASALTQFVTLAGGALPPEDRDEMTALAVLYRQQAQLKPVAERPLLSGKSNLDLSKGMPTVECRVHGRPARFILDTGAEMSLIDPAFGSSIGVEPVGNIHFLLHGNTGSVPVNGSFLRELDVGTVSVRNHPVLLLDLSFLSKELDVQGVLGVQSVFGPLCLLLDLAEGRLEILKTAPTICTGMKRVSGWLPLWCLLGRDLAFTSITIEGTGMGKKCDALVHLDTGGRRSTVTELFVKKTGLKTSAPVKRAALGVSAAVVERPTIKTLGIRAGPLQFRLCDVEAIGSDGTEWITADGKLGMDVLHSCRVILDYPRARWCLCRP